MLNFDKLIETQITNYKLQITNLIKNLITNKSLLIKVCINNSSRLPARVSMKYSLLHILIILRCEYSAYIAYWIQQNVIIIELLPYNLFNDIYS